MKRETLFFLSFGLLTLLIYGQSLFGGFVYDDRGIIDHFALLSQTENVFQVAAYPYWTVDAGLYRPTSLLSYWANIILLGGGAWSFHFVNLILYVGICILLYLVLKKLFQSSRLAYLSALIFLVLPIHTEVVANITGRLELLALFFSLLTLREALKESPNFWFSALWMLLAVGAKETAIATLPLLGLFLFIRKEKIVGRATFGAVFGAVVYFFLRFLVLGPAHFLGVETSLIENPLLFASLHERVATALSIFWMYVSKTFWPVNLCSDYSFNQIPIIKNFWHATSLLGMGVLLGSAGAVLAFSRRNPVVAVSGAFVFFGFITVSNILFPIGTIAGERLFFFASVGVAVLVAYIFNFYLTPLIKVVGGILLLVYVVLSFQRQGVWMSEEKLFINAGQCAPQSVLSLSNLGTVYYFRGEYAMAEKYLLESKAIQPIYSKGLNNLGLVYWKQGRLEEAADLYHQALLQKYPYPGAIENLQILYLSSREYDRARGWLNLTYTPEITETLIEQAKQLN